MGKKISELTEINSAPSDAYTVIEHGGQNYKVKPSGFSGGGGGELYIYTADMGNMHGKSYQAYVNDTSSPKQAYDSSKTLYMLPNYQHSLFTLNMEAIPTPPSNMNLQIAKLIESGNPNNRGFAGFVHNGFVYLGFISGLNPKLITSPAALIQL